jgi:hypothetical protein
MPVEMQSYFRTHFKEVSKSDSKAWVNCLLLFLSLLASSWVSPNTAAVAFHVIDRQLIVLN